MRVAALPSACAIAFLGLVAPALAQTDLPTVSIAPPALAAGDDGHLFEIEGDPGSADQVPGGAWVLTRTGDRSGALTVNLTVTETVGDMIGDFVPASNEGSQTVTFADGDTTVEYRPIGDDSTKESHGTVTVAIAAGTGYEVDADNSSAAVAVRDDDFQMTLTVDPLDLTVVEGKAAQFYAVLSTSNTATFTEADDVGRVMRLRGNFMTPGKKAPYWISWVTLSISEAMPEDTVEAVAPDDFELLTKTLNVAASDFSADGDGYKARIALTPIQTVDDMEEEGPERFLAELGWTNTSIRSLATIASRANIPDLQQNGEVVELSDERSISAVATITDPRPPQVSIAPPTLAAGDDGHLFEIEGDPDSADEVPDGGWVLTRTGDGSGALTVNLTVTETVGEMVGDFVPASNEGSRTVTFADGDTTVEYRPIEDDSIKENHGTVTVAIAAGTGYEVDADNSSAAVAVRDDDFQMTLTVDPLDLTVVEGEAAQFYAVLSTSNTATFTEADDVGRVMRLRGNDTTPGKKAPYPIVWTTFSIEAVRPDDYTALSVALDVKASDFSADGDGYKARVALTPIQTVDDMEEEEPERFLARLALSTESITNLAAVASRANIPDLQQNGEVVELSDERSIRAVATIIDPHDDATLSGLALTETESGDGITLDPTFDPAVLQYTAEVPVGVETITLDAVANHAGATLKYLNVKESELTDADEGTDGFQAGLMLGATVLKVQVEAESGMKQIYSVSVFRPGPPLTLGIDTVADDDVVNIAEKADGFSIAGTVLDGKSDAMSNATVTVEIADETLTATSGSDGTWSVDVPAAAEYLGEPSVTVTVNATKPPFLPAPEVAHTLTVDLTSPTLVSATAQYTRLDLAYDEALATTDLPTSVFSVMVGGIVFSDDIAVSVADSSIALLLPSAVSTGDTVTVSYTTPAETDGKPIRDSADNPVKTLTDHPVENITRPGERCAGSEGSMRLLDGSDAREGRVEVCADDDTTDGTPARWGVVCDDYWTDDDADVVCRALDFERSEPRTERFLRSHFGSGDGLIWLDDLFCNGDESSLLDCPVQGGGRGRDVIGEHNCKVTEIVGVRCMAAGDPLKPHVNGQADIIHPGEDRRYEPGDTLSVRLTFNEPVVVDTSNGTPTIGLLLGAVSEVASRSARYADGSGTRRLEFRYRVATGDGAFEELRLAANSLATNGGTIRNTDGLDAILAHDSDVVPVERYLHRNLSLSDASAQEGSPLQFLVSLNYEAFDAVSVSYRAEAGTATAGTDFEAISGTLTFEPGQSEKTVSVVTLDDAHDDDGETVILTLSDARGATIVDGTATGTIINSDPMPKAWLARFGRAAADHAVQAIDARLSAGDGENAPGGVTLASPDWLGNWSAWGRTASTRFDGTDGPLSIDGEVATATLGLDSRFGRWLAGAAVAYSVGEGAYGHETAAGGDVTSSLASLHPYASYRFNERFSLWGVLGYGVGKLTLQSEGAETAIETGLTSSMVAFGGRGMLRRTAGGLELALVSDALASNTRSDATTGLMGAEGRAQRLRLVLEGSGAIALPGGGELNPRIEAGLRHDAGDAENGTGVEVGGGLAYAAGRLSVQVDARALLAHRDEDYEEWGVSGAVTWQPDALGHGWSMTARSSWGVTASGVESLWHRPATDGVSSDVPGRAVHRFESELGYGLAGLRGRRLWYPFIGTRTADGGAQSVRMGVKLTSGPNLDAALQIGRSAQPGSVPDHTIQLRGAIRW